jgi:hypothetical protein
MGVGAVWRTARHDSRRPKADLHRYLQAAREALLRPGGRTTGTSLSAWRSKPAGGQAPDELTAAISRAPSA